MVNQNFGRFGYEHRTGTVAAGLQTKARFTRRDEADWLPYIDLFNDHLARDRQCAYKAQLLLTNMMVCRLAGYCVGWEEVLEMVQSHLAQFHNIKSAVPHQNDHLHPLDMAARLLPEDLLLLEPRRRGLGGAINDINWYS